MGSNLSSIKTVKQNEYLLKVVSPNNLAVDDSKFWNEFLSYAFTNLDDIW